MPNDYAQKESTKRIYMRRMSYLWKQAAKKWRQEYEIRYPAEVERGNAWRATATRRKELLRRAHKDAIKTGHCHFCLMEFYVDYSEWRHAAGCELSKELSDDQT